MRHAGFLVRADAERFQGTVQAGGGGVDRDGLDPAAQVRGKSLCELARVRAGGDPAGAQPVDHGGNFFHANHWRGDAESVPDALFTGRSHPSE